MREFVARSAKMSILVRILERWRQQGHKALVFAATVHVLNLIQRVVSHKMWPFARMDGNTPVAARMGLVDKFNSDDTFLLLLTTRVGGLGLNLVGANRVVIFEPDWNPAVDAQARERVLRIGQERRVLIYRYFRLF
jgi:DNA excision repair protein ERCC-6